MPSVAVDRVKPRVSEQLAEELLRQGITKAFVLMTSDTARLVVDLSQAGLRVYTTRHEAAAVGMADGYARVSGSLGLAVVGRGPGLTNAMTALVCASKAKSRVVLLVGDDAGLDPKAHAAAASQPKHLDQATMLEGALVPHVTLVSPAAAVADLRATLGFVRTGKTIVINLPTDVLEMPAGDAGPTMVFPIVSQGKPNGDEISAVADLLEVTWAAGHPLILAGRGAALASAGDELTRLGELTGAILGTTLMARTLFAGNPYDVGVVGSFASGPTLDLLREVDVVLAFGAALGRFTTYGGDLFPKARIVQVDSDALAFGRFAQPDLTVLGDAGESARLLNEELERRGHQTIGFRTPATAQLLAESRASEGFRDMSEPSALDPRRLLTCLERVLPADRTLVIDPGHHLTFSSAYLSVPNPASFILPLESGAISTGLGLAMGAAVARPDRATILCVGDGAFMMSLGDLDTAVRYGLRLLTIVMNDSGFGAEIHMLRHLGLPDGIAHYSNPSFEAIARDMGARASTVSSVDDLERIGDLIGPLDGPVLLDCMITQAVRGDWISFHYGTQQPRGSEPLSTA